jgi:hypothetical protein
VPQVKTKNPTKPRRSPAVTHAVIQHPTLTDACDLIGTMLDYETTARTRGIDLTSSRFTMLTATERQMLRAELVADYIRLSSGNMGNTPGYFDSALEVFCAKVCDMKIPSHELVGTYLAAVDVVTKGEYMSHVTGLIEAVRRTMITVLQSCVEHMRLKVEGIGTRE